MADGTVVPLPGIAVAVKDQEQTPEPIVANFVTDANGAFVVKGLTQGVYSVEFNRNSMVVAVAKAGGGIAARCTLFVDVVSSGSPRKLAETPRTSLNFVCGAGGKFSEMAFSAEDRRTYRVSVAMER